MIAATLMTTSCNKDDDDASIAQPAATEFLSSADELSADDETKTVSLSKSASASPSATVFFPQYKTRCVDNSLFAVGAEYDIYITLSGIEWKKVGMGLSYTPGMGFKWKMIKESGPVRCYRISAESPGDVKMSFSTCIGEGRDAKVKTIVSRMLCFEPFVISSSIDNQYGEGRQITLSQLCALTQGTLPVYSSDRLSGHTDISYDYEIKLYDVNELYPECYFSLMGYQFLIEVKRTTPNTTITMGRFFY